MNKRLYLYSRRTFLQTAALSVPFMMQPPGVLARAGQTPSGLGTHSSELWGTAGEKWNPRSRLPDFSFAGYHAGERPIPDVRVKANVKDYGAKGDGRNDDTAAFQRAIAAVREGAISIPPGRYRMREALVIEKPGVVLRGAGREATALLFDRSFEALLGAGQVPYWGGLLEIRGEQAGGRLANVSAAAKRGDQHLQLASAPVLQPGRWVRLRMTNPDDNSLGNHLYADQNALNEERRRWYGGRIVDWAVPIAAVDGKVITLARPLRLDVRPEWRPEIWWHRPTVREVGIEDLTIEFPNTQYRGHHKEEGWFAIQLRTVFNCWIRRVTIVDCDLGVGIMAGGHNTLSNVTLKTRWRSGAEDVTGHYGFGVRGLTQDNLVEDSALLTSFVHNLSVNAFANGNVYSRISTRTGRFDHHGAAPYENLYTEIVVTENARDLFLCGGNRADEANSGARTTFWNIRALKGDFPGNRRPEKFPQINLIGLDRWPAQRTKTEAWIERWPGETTLPPNLYEAQKTRRFERDGKKVQLD